MGPPSLRVLLMPKPTTYGAKKPEEVDAEAWAHVASEGGDSANATLILSRWKVQFGRYQGKTFQVPPARSGGTGPCWLWGLQM